MERGDARQAGAFYSRAAAAELVAESALECGIKLCEGRGSGWWAELQPGLLHALGRLAGREPLLPGLLPQLRRLRRLAEAEGGTAPSACSEHGADVSATAGGISGSAGGASSRGGSSSPSMQRFLQLAAALVHALTTEPDRDMAPPKPAPPPAHGRYGYRSSYAYTYAQPQQPACPPRTAAFVEELFLLLHVPGNPGGCACATLASLQGGAVASHAHVPHVPLCAVSCL